MVNNDLAHTSNSVSMMGDQTDENSVSPAGMIHMRRNDTSPSMISAQKNEAQREEEKRQSEENLLFIENTLTNKHLMIQEEENQKEEEKKLGSNAKL